MPLLLPGVLILLISGAALAQLQYYRSISRQECEAHENRFKPAPVYNQGDNLSFEGCGVIGSNPRSKADAPWHVSIGRGDCEGLLISRRAILVHQTPFGLCALNERVTEPDQALFGGPLIAYLGRCVLDRNPSCAEGEEGFIREVRQVRRLNVYPEDNLFVLLIDVLPRPFPDSVKPICLYKEDNLADSKTSFRYSLADARTVRVAPSVRECMPQSMLIDRCKRYTFAICIIGSADAIVAERNSLFKVDASGRYFLRGVAFSNSREVVHTNIPFHDILMIIDAIVRETPDVHRLPSVPAVDKQVVFSDSEQLSYQNCGLETGDIRPKRRTLETDDLSTIGHVFGGQVAEQGKHPWHAHIAIGSRQGDANICSGSLISDKAIVTAAHCVFIRNAIVSPRDIHVTLGMWNASASFENSRQSQQPQRIFVSSGYNSSANNFRGDVAVLTFENPFRFTNYVQPVCLWNLDADLDKVSNENGVLVGWGLSDEYERPQALQRAELTIRSHRDCFLQNRPFFSSYLQPGINFCAGHSNGTSACNGDSGGGLMVRRGARWFLRGIVSFGKARKIDGHSVCDSRYYSLFTDVASYVPWIVTLIHNN